MRITVTVVVIMFELTGALTYILPTMVKKKNNNFFLLTSRGLTSFTHTDRSTRDQGCG